jgi:pectin methylesterase-like acyl-CoA thioesterase
VVGTCQPGANSLPTIGAAVTAVGTNGVIKICPGTYPEQVVINRSMTLAGVSNSNSAYPSIVVPVTGLVTNTTDFETGQPTAAQILVTSGATVNISGLTVDGSNNNITT